MREQRSCRQREDQFLEIPVATYFFCSIFSLLLLLSSKHTSCRFVFGLRGADFSLSSDEEEVYLLLPFSIKFSVPKKKRRELTRRGADAQLNYPPLFRTRDAFSVPDSLFLFFRCILQTLFLHKLDE